MKIGKSLTPPLRIVAAVLLSYSGITVDTHAQFQPAPRTRIRSANAAGSSASNGSVPPRLYVVVPIPNTNPLTKVSDAGLVLARDSYADMNRKSWAISGATVLDLVGNRVMTLNPLSYSSLETIIPSEWFVPYVEDPQLEDVYPTGFWGERIADNGDVVGFTTFQADFTYTKPEL